MSRTSAHARLRANDGFALIEVMIAVVLLVVGLLGLFLSLDTTVQTSFTTRAREGAVTLAREITEDAHAITFSQVSPTTITTQLEAMPGMSSTSQTSWQVVRRGVTYTITATDCSIDDPKDGYGAHDSTFCADSSQTGTADAQPIDFKRVTVSVTWTSSGLNHTINEVTTISAAGQAVSLATTNLQLATPAVGSTGVTGTAAAPTITSASISQLTFSVTAPTGTTSIIWSLDGAQQSWTSTSSGTTWTSSAWTVTGLSDGTYEVSAQAQNANGTIGPATTMPVNLARNVPAAPNVVAYGFNQNLYSGGALTAAPVAELRWQPNTELNVSGYRIYNPSGTLICQTSSSTSYAYCPGTTNAWCMTEYACVDLNAPAITASNLTYKVVPLYYDATGVLTEGPSTSVTLTGGTQKTYTFSPTTGNSGFNCSSSGLDMLATYTPGADNTVGNSTFCSTWFSSGTVVGAGGTATTYWTNTANGACTVTATLSVDGTKNTQTATASIAQTGATPVQYTFNFATGGSLTMAAFDKLDLAFAITGGGGCGTKTNLHYGSASYLSQFTSGTSMPAAPNAPGSLTVTPQSDGTAVLTWSPPSSGTTASAYRIYRDGHDFTNRIDYIDSGMCTTSCTYTDKNRTTAHSYYVTSVGGATAGSNENESAPAGPVTG